MSGHQSYATMQPTVVSPTSPTATLQSSMLGSSYVNKSGLAPAQYKAFTTEYGTEYKSIATKKEECLDLTQRHGMTTDVMKEARFQFAGYPQGYPQSQYRLLSPTSLTAKGSIMPNYHSDVKGY